MTDEPKIDASEIRARLVGASAAVKALCDDHKRQSELIEAVASYLDRISEPLDGVKIDKIGAYVPGLQNKDKAEFSVGVRLRRLAMVMRGEALE